MRSRWNPFRSSRRSLETFMDIMGIEGEGPANVWGWLTYLGQAVAVTVIVSGLLLLLCLAVCIGGAR